MTKTEEAKGLLAIALDATRSGKERLKALLAANGIRQGLKVGWAKLTPDGEAINYASVLAEVQDMAEEDAEKAEKPKPAAKPKAGAKAKAPKDEERGKISALVRELLTGTDKPYAEIVAEVVKAHPAAKTTARSVASVASDLRKAGRAVAMRRQEAAA